MTSRAAIFAATFAAMLAAPLAGCESCRKQLPLTTGEDLPYPDCGRGELPDGEVVASGHLRSGPTMRDKEIVERFELRRRDCLYTMRVRQEWPLGVADVDVVWDEEGRPLRAWKRMTLPGVEDVSDIRRYELRGERVVMKVRNEEGRVEWRELRGPRPIAVIGPGRGLLTMWIRSADLEVGEKARGPVLDFREPFERIRDVTLERKPDLHEPSLGRTVRVYTIYGREPVFTDDDGAVIGDMAGLRPHESLDTPEPPPAPMYGEPDPIGTP